MSCLMLHGVQERIMGHFGMKLENDNTTSSGDKAEQEIDEM